MAPHEEKQATPMTTTAAAAASADAAPAPHGEKDALFEYAPPSYFGAQSRVPKALQPWIADAFMFVVYHYNLWAVPVLAFFYYLYHVRSALCVCCCYSCVYAILLTVCICM